METLKLILPLLKKGKESSGGTVGIGGTVPAMISTQGFSKEQCEQLIHMLQAMQVGTSNGSGTDANANFVGKSSFLL